MHSLNPYVIILDSNVNCKLFTYEHFLNEEKTNFLYHKLFTRYYPPEVFYGSKESIDNFNVSGSIWSMGIILLELCLGRDKVSEIIHGIDNKIVYKIFSELDCDVHMKRLIESCLIIDNKKRAKIENLKAIINYKLLRNTLNQQETSNILIHNKSEETSLLYTTKIIGDYLKYCSGNDFVTAFLKNWIIRNEKSVYQLDFSRMDLSGIEDKFWELFENLTNAFPHVKNLKLNSNK